MMTAEVEVPNPDLELVPGTYASVVLKVENRPHALAIPIGGGSRRAAIECLCGQ